MKNNLIKILVICFVMVLAAACKEHGEIIVSQNKNKISFSLTNLDTSGAGTNSYLLYSIGVTRIDCERDCIMWEMMRDKKYYDSYEHALTSAIFEYGFKPEAMYNLVEPVALTAGKYTVIVNAALLKNNKLIRSNVLSKQFALIKKGDRFLLAE